MKNIVLTGSSGFIGQNLCTYLKDKNYNIYSVSRGDLELKKGLSGFFNNDSQAGADVLIHLVGAAHGKFTNDAAEYINFDITKKVIDRAVSLGISRFIYLSSAGVYMGCHGKVLSDTDLYYSELPNTMQSKLDAESYIKKLGLERGIEIVIIRCPLVYGSGVKGNFASLMALVEKGWPLPVALLNSNYKSLVSVRNLMDLIVTCIDHPKAANETFLVSDDHDVSTSKMVRQMAIALDKPTWQFPVPIWCYKLAGKLFGKSYMVERLVGSLQVDITHTKQTLDWKPSQSLEEGFRQTAQALLNSKK